MSVLYMLELSALPAFMPGRGVTQRPLRTRQHLSNSTERLFEHTIVMQEMHQFSWMQSIAFWRTRVSARAGMYLPPVVTNCPAFQSCMHLLTRGSADIGWVR